MVIRVQKRTNVNSKCAAISQITCIRRSIREAVFQKALCISLFAKVNQLIIAVVVSWAISTVLMHKQQAICTTKRAFIFGSFAILQLSSFQTFLKKHPSNYSLGCTMNVQYSFIFTDIRIYLFTKCSRSADKAVPAKNKQTSFSFFRGSVAYFKSIFLEGIPLQILKKKKGVLFNVHYSFSDYVLMS